MISSIMKIEELQKIVDEIEKNARNTINVVWIDGLEFRDPDKFMEYLREKGYI